MTQFLLRNASRYTRNLLHHYHSSTTAPFAASSLSRFRFFSSSDENPSPPPSTNEEKPSKLPSIKKDPAPLEVKDVGNKGFIPESINSYTHNVNYKPEFVNFCFVLFQSSKR